MKQLRFFLTILTVAGLAVAASRPGKNASVNAQAGSVAPAAPMLDTRSGHSATLLPDGRVLIVGGMRRNNDFYKSAEWKASSEDEANFIDHSRVAYFVSREHVILGERGARGSK